MRYLIVTSVSLLLLTLTGPGLRQSFAMDGKAVFDSLYCSICHKPHEGVTGVTLPQIARAYKNPEHLMQYFNGKTEAIVEPSKSSIMWGQLKKIQKLPEAKQKALADYILTFK